eukprot:CAMPEP_0184644470 /NCGR_PEP_ID=MMETSP0308-20130426/1183_1 /TAXON_ID=38269 /ORGANISM="Gloeochaete witrockiana, Strain SAG 46.84" /LENGTH=396 /DNA_ID=CAMNT_0027073019 /DNA_START=422 /DNA_END=1609 /DNA_ORIENTATION=+
MGLVVRTAALLLCLFSVAYAVCQIEPIGTTSLARPFATFALGGVQGVPGCGTKRVLYGVVYIPPPNAPEETVRVTSLSILLRKTGPPVSVSGIHFSIYEGFSLPSPTPLWTSPVIPAVTVTNLTEVHYSLPASEILSLSSGTEYVFAVEIPRTSSFECVSVVTRPVTPDLPPAKIYAKRGSGIIDEYTSAPQANTPYFKVGLACVPCRTVQVADFSGALTRSTGLFLGKGCQSNTRLIGKKFEAPEAPPQSPTQAIRLLGIKFALLRTSSEIPVLVNGLVMSIHNSDILSALGSTIPTPTPIPIYRFPIVPDVNVTSTANVLVTLTVPANQIVFLDAEAEYFLTAEWTRQSGNWCAGIVNIEEAPGTDTLIYSRMGPASTPFTLEITEQGEVSNDW